MRAIRFVSMGVPAALVALGGACALSTSETPTQQESVGEKPENLLGEYEVVVDTVRGTVDFKPIDVPAIDPATSPGLHTKNFEVVNSGNIKFATASSIYGASSMVPAALTTPRADAAGCSAGEFCAQISAQNMSGQAVDNMFIEVTSIGAGASVTSKGDLDAGITSVTTAHVQSPYGTQTNTNYVTFANGAYWYGSLANMATASRNWHFSTSVGATFTFKVRVLATFQRSSYTAQDGGVTTSGTTPFTKYNACDTSAGHVTSPTTIAALSGTVDDVAATFTLPFPVTIYGTSDTSAWVNSNGTFGLGTTTSTTPGNAALPSTSSPRPAIFPFFDDMYGSSTAAVCYGLADDTGTGPRAFVITWKDWGFYDQWTNWPNFFNVQDGWDGTKRTFSLVLREFSDQAELIYYNPSSVGKIWGGDLFSHPSAEANVRGSSATVGIQNAAGTSAAQQSNNTQFLPATGDASYPLRIILKPNADPVACPSGGCNSG